jgi:hypothetical protein
MNEQGIVLNASPRFHSCLILHSLPFAESCFSGCDCVTSRIAKIVQPTGGSGADLLSIASQLTSSTAWIGGLRDDSNPPLFGWSWVDGTPSTNLNCGTMYDIAGIGSELPSSQCSIYDTRAFKEPTHGLGNTHSDPLTTQSAHLAPQSCSAMIESAA